MARIQILELPMVDRGDDGMETPFIVIIDQASEETRAALGLTDERLTPMEAVRRTLSVSLAQQLGARAILAFEETVDIPANETPVGPDGYPVRLRVEGDFQEFREQVQAEATAASNTVTRARYVAEQHHDGGHAVKDLPLLLRAENAETRLKLARGVLIEDGYFTADEIGDDIAPRLVEWLIHHRQDVENFQGRALAARERTRRIDAELRNALGLDNDEAIDVLAAAQDICRKLERSRETIRSVLHLHRGESHQGRPVCVECSALDAQGTTDNSPVAYPCDTVKALGAKPDETMPESPR